MESGCDGMAGPTPKRALCFLDLPSETQHGIISHCSQTDLICVALVSKHFHELASARLYRNFHIIFPDDDDIDFDSPIDGLAGGLDTFTTSDYDYAKHLKDLSMDTLSSGPKGELSYQPYLYSASCGKFFNTLLHLMLKRAKALEAFSWNIRVELTRPVYRELHRISTLKKVHIRMQAGDSYYTPPPPLPIALDSHHIPPMASNHYESHHAPPDYTLPHLNGPPPPLYPPIKSSSRHRGSKRISSCGPATFSAFKNLSTLSVLEIDSLDVISELQICVRNSFSTLTELKISLSDTLASQSRRPLADSDTEDSEIDDGYSHAPYSQYGATGPAKVYRAQEERKKQELILAKVFDLEPNLVKKPQIQLASENPADIDTIEAANAANIDRDPRDDFVESLRGASTKLMTLVNGSRDFSLSQRDILDMIEKAARKYLDSAEQIKEEQVAPPSAASSSYSSNAGPSSVDKGKSIKQKTGPSTVPPWTVDECGRSTCMKKPTPVPTIDKGSIQRGGTKDSEECTIDATECEHVEDVNKESEAAGHVLEPCTVSNVQPATTNEQASEALATPVSKSQNTPETVMPLNQLDESIKSLKLEDKPSNGSQDSAEDRTSTIVEYIRDTRGLALEHLSIQLVPVKPSVLSRAINLSALKSLTLLNVGNQGPIWSMLTRENKVQPLALRSIFTDNVSHAFLTCVSQLAEVHDLFMLERSIDHKPESFAPRASTSIDQIRRLVLKKHISTIKRLFLKDESKEAGWDANEKTMILLCTQGKALEELAVSMNIHAVHAFMQYFSGLVSLRALNILHFKNNDTCLWVMKEILRFIVDNLSHQPQLKLEWIAMEDDRVDRVVRPSENVAPRESDEAEKHHNARAAATAGKARVADSVANDDGYPIISTDHLDYGSESEDDTFDSGGRLRYQTIGPLQFYDVWGVKIFEKEIRSGQL